VELLEILGTSEARALLAELAKDDSPLARSAAATAKRLTGK
jgi:hypothetical protein